MFLRSVSPLKRAAGGMEPICTCNERTRINRRAILTAAIDKKDNRPNGSAIRSFLNYRSGSSRTCFLIKETKRQCSSDSEIKGREKEDGGLQLKDKYVRTSVDDVQEKSKCSSKICESALSGVETNNRVREHVVTTATCNNSTSTSSTEVWDEEIVLRHIKECRCTCNHMGYGNYLDWSERLSAVPPAPPRCLTPRSYGSADCTTHLNLTHAHKKLSPGSGSLSLTQEASAPTDKGSASRSWCLACMLLVLLTLTGIGVVLPLTTRLRHGFHNFDYLSAVRSMLRDVPLVDGHNDLAWNVRNFVHNQLQRFNFSADLRTVAPWATSNWSHTDLPRMQQGMLGAQFWSAYVPCEAQYKDAVQLTLEQINVIRRLVDSYTSELQFVTSSQGIENAHRSGRIASLVGVEGGHSLGASLGVLRAMYDLGVRYLTLTHTCHTPWADSSSAAASESNTRGEGLTEFGKVVVRELNRLGILVDLSHAAHETVLAVLETTRSPVIFSHSSAQALCNTSRNVPDHILRLVAENGGLVMVSFYADFLTCTAFARMEDVMRHVTHIRDVAGEDHVGIGAGYDGINRTPVGLEDVSRYPYLLAELARTQGWTMNQLEKLAGRNFLRVFRKVEKVKEELRRLAVDPYEDWIPPSDLLDYNKDGCLGR